MGREIRRIRPYLEGVTLQMGGGGWGVISCKVKLIPNLEISPWDGIKTSPCEMHSTGLRNTNPGSNKAFWILFMTVPPFISDVSCKTQHNGKWLSVPFSLFCCALLSRFMIYTDLFIRFSIFFEIVDKIENWEEITSSSIWTERASNCHFKVRRSLLTADSDWV